MLEAGLRAQAPQAAALLAQFGADVTKVELPGFGDQSRFLPSRSATTPAARTSWAATGASEQADIVSTNFKPGTMDE